jgi:hypothetical protein
MTTADVTAFVDLFQRHPVPRLIANLQTRVDQISIGNQPIPITLNDGAPTCYICDPVTAYIAYAVAETRHFTRNPLLFYPLRALIRAAAPLVRASGMGHQVQVNNWLFSTNPLPLLTPDMARALRDDLTAAHPHRAIVIRSLNTLADAPSLTALREAGFRALPARQVYLYDGRNPPRPSANIKRDRQALARTPHHLVTDADFTDDDYIRAARLYAMLYLEKYTPLNPDYTPLYLREMHRAGLMRLRGLRGSDGALVAVTGMFINGRTLTQPIVGYDTTRPMAEGLYRIIMAMAQQVAEDEALFFNISAGAAAFKRLRRAQPVIEYTAVYANHLPRRKQRALHAMERLLTGIGVPLLQRFEL